ncbi:DUF4259 domain-containing protein [Deinococcus sp.]|uniref:DUF4259 domain-containing protein n=1 Tax=Deinococcus sp. TaxID=47478 RepID=UPI0026005F6B|nr:DUF4259 domain-containing protein [Deinococcus sp.]
MDIWGTQAFDNDAARLFIQEVGEDGAFALQEAFEVVLDPDTEFVAGEEGARAVAAAEILVAHLSNDTEAIMDARLREWLGSLDEGELDNMRELGAEALGRVTGGDSELVRHFAASEGGDEWTGNLARLRDALA